jgi:autotransporter-associated beta strand protein
LLARSFVGTGQLTANITVGNSLVNGIIGPWAYGQTAANVPTWLTISSGIIAPATLTSVTNANNLTSGNGTYTSASTGTTTLAADRAAYVWANTGAGGTTDLGDFNLTLSAFSTGAGNQTISGTGTGRLVIGGNELILIPSNGAIIISAGIASGTGHLTIAPYGNGNVTLSGSNAHSGGTSIHKNTLNVNSANALGTGTFTISGGNIDNTSAGDITLATNNAQVWNTDFTYAGATRNLNMGTGSVSLGTYAGATRTVTVTGNTLTIGGAISNGTHADLPTTGLTKTGAGTLVLSGINTYTGTTTVSAGAMTLTDNAQLKFVIGASGINNSLNGIGTVNLDGDFNFNLTGAGTTIGNSWNIINVSTLTETFNGTFSVVGFTRQGGGTGAGLWDGSANSAQYQFDTASGLLTVVPEPSTWALLAFSLTTIMVLRRRRQS